MSGRKVWPCLNCLVMMIAVDEDHCKCPACGTEVWHQYDAPDLSGDAIGGDNADAKTEYVSRSLPEGYRVPSGGSKSGKRTRNKGTKIWSDNDFGS